MYYIQSIICRLDISIFTWPETCYAPLIFNYYVLKAKIFQTQIFETQSFGYIEMTKPVRRDVTFGALFYH